MSTLTAAEEARLAHSALRLRETGFTTERQVRDLANLVPADALDPPPEGEDVTIGNVRSVLAHPLSRVALSVVHALEPSLPGPTDKKAVRRLFNDGSLTDVWEAWDAASTANVEGLLEPAELTAWRESRERDAAAFDERLQLWVATGGQAEDFHPYFGHNRHLDGAANALYDIGRQGFLDGSIDWDTAVIKVALVDSAVYTVNLATNQFMSSIASVVATSAALTTKTVTAGVADGDDFAFATVTGAASEALVIYQSSAVGGGADVASSAQRLIGYIDTATGLPVTPNGGNINVVWDSGSNRIFKL